ncbi:UNVERIFIED_CONTAM: hypothetical protein Scaly_2814400 [Sesamum calycinum]|uniref:Uncharacterized protein n=1 Tax=Sesamum calycinum TaxID=2727403 RepID=A0AAW2ITQ6_9LAMI
MDSGLNGLKSAFLLRNRRMPEWLLHRASEIGSWMGAPGLSRKNLLVLNSIAPNENPQEVNLDWAEFYVHVQGLPLSKMSKEMAAFIGNHLGRFIDVDMDSAGHVWGSHMRIRASVDVTKPLRRVLKL